MIHFEEFRRAVTTFHFAISNKVSKDTLIKWITHHSESSIKCRGFRLYCEIGKATDRIPEWLSIIQEYRPDHAVEFIPNVTKLEIDFMNRLIREADHYYDRPNINAHLN